MWNISPADGEQCQSTSINYDWPPGRISSISLYRCAERVRKAAALNVIWMSSSTARESRARITPALRRLHEFINCKMACIIDRLEFICFKLLMKIRCVCGMRWRALASERSAKLLVRWNWFSYELECVGVGERAPMGFLRQTELRLASHQFGREEKSLHYMQNMAN